MSVRQTRLPRTVVALGVVSLLTDMSSEMIYPLLPAFLTTVLGAGAVALGVVEGVAETTAALVKVASGHLTDRVRRRKPLVVAGYAISSAARPLIGLAGSWPVVVALRFVDRFGKGVRTSPRDALIADVTPAASRGRSYGFHRAMDHAGAVIGPLLAAGLLLIPAMTLRGVFLLAAVPAVAVIVVLLTAVAEPPAGSDRESPAEGFLAGAASLGPGFRRLLTALVVFTLGNSTDAFLLLRFTEAGLEPGWVAVLWAAHHVVKMVSSSMGGRLSDRVGTRGPITAGWALYALVYLGFAVTDSLPALVTLFLAYGVYFGLTEPVEKSWVASLAPAGLRGTAFGLYNGAVGIAALPASVLFGVLYSTFGPAAAFGTGAGLAAVASLLLRRVPAP